LNHPEVVPIYLFFIVDKKTIKIKKCVQLFIFLAFESNNAFQNEIHFNIFFVQNNMNKD